jgi:hypothetical protein
MPSSPTHRRRFVTGWIDGDNSAVMAFIWEITGTGEDAPVQYEAEVIRDIYKFDTLRAATVDELRSLLETKYGSSRSRPHNGT